MQKKETKKASAFIQPLSSKVMTEYNVPHYFHPALTSSLKLPCKGNGLCIAQGLQLVGYSFPPTQVSYISTFPTFQPQSASDL